MNLNKWLKSEKYRRLIERWWIALVLTWDIFKSIMVDETFAKYGVNPYIYLVIVVSISIPYAKTTARMLFAIIARRWRSAISFGTVAIILHFIPDLYILASAKEVPRTLFDGFIITVLLFSAFAVYGVVNQVRSRRSE